MYNSQSVSQENVEAMMHGVVSFYDVRKGFGFIRGDDGQRVFVHKSELPFWTIYLQKGDKVAYRVSESKRGLIAMNLALKES
jgi:CspA family cold shock protein